MAGTRSKNTMSEGLTAMLGEVAQMMALPDADLDTLSGLQAQLIKTLRAPQEQAMMRYAEAGGVVPGMGDATQAAAGMPTPGGAPPAQMPLDMALGGLPAPGGGGGAGGNYKPWGVRNGGATPPVDELRRLVASEGLA